MPKYLLLKHYRGGPEAHHPFPPMDQWAPEDVEAHIAFQRHVIATLEESGEYVGAEALTPERTWVRRGEDFDAAEDALQEALMEAMRVWPQHPPDDPRAWLTTVATRRLVDARRSEAARRRREETSSAEPPAPAVTEEGDDTLFLLF